jgi:hypothetical protein
VTGEVGAGPHQDSESRGPGEASPADASQQLGFNIGTFLGAFLISLLGGMSLAVALGFGWVVRTVAARTRRRRGPGFIGSVAVLGLLGAFALAATSLPHFGEDRQAVAKLREAKSAIDQGHLVAAMRELGGAALLENESVSITVLSSCVDWQLGYKDYALFQAQVALNLGYRPEETTHFRGRGCFLDVVDFQGVDFVKMPSSGWFIYPIPDKDDALGQRYLAIARDEDASRFGDRFVALGCLSSRYDMRSLAAFEFTLGLNASLRLGEGETPYRVIKHCLKDKSVASSFDFRTNPATGLEEFKPVDFLARIPSPRRHDPPDVCWARFPLGGPCGDDE